MRPRLFSLLAVTLVGAGLTGPRFGLAQQPSAWREADLVTQLQVRHAGLLAGLIRGLKTVNNRASDGRPIDWDRVTRLVKAARLLDAELTLREMVLASRAKGPAGRPGLKLLIALERKKVKELLATLSTWSPKPLSDDRWFTGAAVAPAIASPPTTAAQTRVLLRTVPVSSADDLFGATAGLKKSQLPTRGR
jgi:hypothetical protein